MPNKRFLYLQTYVCMGKDEGIHTLIYNALLTTLHLAEKIFIIIAHMQKAHFSLLYMDLNELKWYHLNPYIKSRSLAGNDYFKDALKMVNTLLDTSILIQ